MSAESNKPRNWDKKKTEKTIEVFLAKGENPEVQVDEMVWGRPKMKFVKDPDSDDFEFVKLKFDNPANPFKNIKRQKKQISIDNDGEQGKWLYKITVEGAGGSYTTEEKNIPPGGDRPVIRN